MALRVVVEYPHGSPTVPLRERGCFVLGVRVREDDLEYDFCTARSDRRRDEVDVSLKGVSDLKPSARQAFGYKRR